MKALRNVSMLIAFGMCADAAESLADAFKNGNVTGELRSYYFNQKTGDEKADILDFAVRLNYTTDSYYGFRGGATFQSSSSPFIDEDAKNMFGAPNNMYGPGAV
ncbi:MAG: porin, partial [Campylobacteraceae bacterium]|nr:porin [Campylobacteraceae bacterium]